MEKMHFVMKFFRRFALYASSLALMGIMTCLKAQVDASESIAIVGGGLAGLTAAFKLFNAGFENLTVYEARQHRVGGKIMTCKFVDAEGKERYAELGAENILDGGAALNIRGLAQELGLELFHSYDPSITVQYYDGTSIIDPSLCEYIKVLNKDTLWDGLEDLHKKQSSMGDILQCLFPNDVNLRNYFTIRLSCFEGGLAPELSSWYINSFHNFLLDKIDPEHADRYDREFRECLCIKGGNSLLPTRLAQRLAGHIKLDHQLTTLAKNDTGTYTLTFANGVCVTCDIVILAMPCTVYADINFAAGVIPPDTLSTIKNIRYGKNSKILSPIQASDRLGHVYCNDHAMLYQAKQSDILSLFYCGDASYFTQETIAARFAEDMPFIRALYATPAFIGKPVTAQDRDMVAYTSPVGHSWMTDPYAKGSYSFIAPGQETLLMAMHECAGEKVRTVFAPIGTTLFFAGEHTTIGLDILGTMEAAVESGVRIARIITNLYPKIAPQPMVIELHEYEAV